jgi:hypothetical protein
MDEDTLACLSWPVAEEDESPARVLRDGLDALHTESLAKGILVPSQTLVGREQDVIHRLLVVDEHDDRTRVTKLPHVRVLVDFLPRKAAVTSEEDVRVGVWCKLLAHITHS